MALSSKALLKLVLSTTVLSITALSKIPQRIWAGWNTLRENLRANRLAREKAGQTPRLSPGQSDKHWSTVALLHETVTNPNIILKGTHSYYSDAYDDGFEQSVVRYLLGDEVSRHWKPRWKIDKLFIGDYVCIGAEAVILMGGNHTHRHDWFSLYPFADTIEESYQGKGDTILADGCWIGMRAMIMPGVTIGEGAIVAANSVVTQSVAPYTIVGGSPARFLRHRFSAAVTNKLLTLRIYDWPEEKFTALKPLLCASDIEALEHASQNYDMVQA